MYLSPNLALIDQRLPSWLRNASPERHEQLKQRVLQGHRAFRALRQALEPVQGIQTFCRPLLDQALANNFPEQTLPDVHTARVRLEDDGHTLSWLEAALQNLDEASNITLYASPYTTEHLALDTTRFIKTIRTLDLGQRYQDHLHEHLDTDVFRALLRNQDHATFAATLTQAHLQGLLDSRGEQLGEAALADLEHIPSPDGTQRTLECHYLSVFGIPLNGPLILRLTPTRRTEPCLLYIPGDPQAPLRQYPSQRALGLALTRRLWQHEYRAFFSRFVAQAQQPLFVERLRNTLFPHYPYDTLQTEPPVLEKGEHFGWLRLAFPPVHGIWQQTLDKNARLPWTLTPWPGGDCFSARTRSHVALALSDAAAVAVPVAQHDAAARRARIESWLKLGLGVANVAGLLVPALGELMMVVGGAQLVDEFLDGVHAANEGDADAALSHLFDIVLNLAQVAALGSAESFSEPAGVLHGWHVAGTGAKARLWSGELAPFARSVEWSEQTAPAMDGLIDWQGHRWIELQGQKLSIARGPQARWRLSASRAHRHPPTLLGNTRSPWLLEHERPLSWQGPPLLRRLAMAATTLDDQALQHALRCSGHNEAEVRQWLLDHQTPPARMLDSLELFGATRFPAAAPALPGDEVLVRDFPSLSSRSRTQLLGEAKPVDLAALQRSARLPLALAESARYHLREARIMRALAAFHGLGDAAHDRDLLALANLERLPGWTGNTRVELRDMRPDGPLLSAVGAEELPTKRVVRSESGYQPFDALEQSLGNPSDLYQALLNALPDDERIALGMQIHEPGTLRDTLFELAASDRARTARALGMTPIRPMYRLPTRTLYDTRLGYRLSGRSSGMLSDDELFDQLYPSLDATDRQTLRQRLREQAGEQPGAFGRLLEQQRSDYQRLDSTLERWIDETGELSGAPLELRRAARSIAAQRLRRAWRLETEGDPLASIDYVTLELRANHLGALPALPIHLEGVRHLSLTGIPAMVDLDNLGAFLEAFPRLSAVDLCGNNLMHLPGQLGNLDQLIALDLSENQLQLDSGPTLDVLSRLTGLLRLNLTDAVQGLPVDALARLAQLPSLRSFQADLNSLNLTDAHFDALAQWPALRSISLGNNDITLTEQSRNALASLTQLSGLYLHDNPLGLAPDLTGWHSLEILDLQDCGLENWPQGLEALMRREPLALRDLDLSDNHLSDAPALAGSSFSTMVNNGGTANFNFNNNPFTPDAMARLAEAFQVPDAQPVATAPWYADWPEALRDHVIMTSPDVEWQPLYALFDRLPDTFEYIAHPQAFNARMQHVLRVLSTPAQAQAGEGWGLSEVHQQINDQLNDAAQACIDQASLLFQQVETDVMLWQTMANASSAAENDAVAVACLNALLRQRLLDERIGALYNARIARRQALSAATDDAALEAAPALHADDDIRDTSLTEPNFLLDELEMALAARMQLRDALGLPPQPGDIAFGHLARLSDATLERLAQAVSSEASAQRVVDWALQQRFWQTWLRRLRPQEFTQQARDWEGASEYHNALSEAGPQGEAYRGPAVPAGYIDALQGELGDVPGLVWSLDGVVQRVDLVSNRYPNESALYQRASELLLSSRQVQETALARRLTMEIVQAHTS
ncbi:dermonecrotic toxin domain-containing protein [Pseudomonas sp. NPDC089554]|uniref:dermonecrotic toxin domain-containing protein n=1 Tax=Pseudomonas sp. NPDC089554 TaxID=3390653 RepID=UPI003D016F18